MNDPLKALAILPIQAISASGVGPDVDISVFGISGLAVLETLNGAGTLPTLAAKIQHSEAVADGYSQSTVGAVETSLRSGVSTNIGLAAGFLQTGDASIKHVYLMLKNNGTIAAGKKMTLRLESDNEGSPSNSVLGTAETVLCSVVGTSYTLVEFVFANSVDVTNGSTYWLVLTADYDASASNKITLRTLTVTSGGNSAASVDGTTWVVGPTLSFEVRATRYSWTDTGISFAGATTGLAESQKFVNPDQLKQFVRVKWTLGGSAGPTYTACAILVGQPQFTS